MKNTLKRKITEEGSTNKKGNKFETFCQTSIEFKKIAVTFFLIFFLMRSLVTLTGQSDQQGSQIS